MSPLAARRSNAKCVEVIAGEQGEVVVVAREQPRGAVVEEIPLAHRLDHARVLALAGVRADRRLDDAG